MIRIGHGYDVHRLGAARPLWLGGVEIPHTQGLIAHSDGDVVLHAIIDALLGALAMGDIGKWFPDTDSQFKGVDSRQLLRHCVQLADERRWTLGNLDVTIEAQAPKLRPYIDDMRATIAADFSAQLTQVNVKATTTEQLGFVGRKEGIACHAVILMESL